MSAIRIGMGLAVILGGFWVDLSIGGAIVASGLLDIYLALELPGYGKLGDLVARIRER